MQCRLKVGNLALAGAVALLLVACNASTRSRSSDRQPSDADAIEDSGKRLSGDFDLNAVEDDYRLKGAQAQAVFSFDENGNFKRQDKSRVDEGGYVIGSNGELVVYIEKVNGEQLAAARVDRYALVDQRGDSITLQSGPSRTIVLRKR